MLKKDRNQITGSNKTSCGSANPKCVLTGSNVFCSGGRLVFWCGRSLRWEVLHTLESLSRSSLSCWRRVTAWTNPPTAHMNCKQEISSSSSLICIPLLAAHLHHISISLRKKNLAAAVKSNQLCRRSICHKAVGCKKCFVYNVSFFFFSPLQLYNDAGVLASCSHSETDLQAAGGGAGQGAAVNIGWGGFLNLLQQVRLVKYGI